jgi:cobalt-zinc-cadmium efflux system outer membrane protein
LLGPLRDRARNLRSKAEAARRRETVTGFDARLLKSEALALEADWLASRAELDVADAALREWLGLAPGASLDLADDLDVRRWRCDTDSALAAALGNRRTLARAAAAESLAMQRVALEQRLNRVNPALGVSAGRERMEIERQGLSPLVDEDTMVGLELRVPLPLFATNSAALGEARLELERARAEREASIRDVREEVVTACTQLERAEELRALRRDAAESADQDLRLIESAYEGGRIPLDEYLTLRERLVRQELGLLDAVADVEASRARLIRATGIARAEWMRRAEEQP